MFMQVAGLEQLLYREQVEIRILPPVCQKLCSLGDHCLTSVFGCKRVPTHLDHNRPTVRRGACSSEYFELPSSWLYTCMAWNNGACYPCIIRVQKDWSSDSSSRASWSLSFLFVRFENVSFVATSWTRCQITRKHSENHHSPDSPDAEKRLEFDGQLYGYGSYFLDRWRGYCEPHCEPSHKLLPQDLRQEWIFEPDVMGAVYAKVRIGA